MTQIERRTFLIRFLLNEQPRYRDMKIPQSEQEQRRLLRALLNIRMPKETDIDFMRIQDEYLREEIARKGITDYRALSSLEKGIYLWQGDITTNPFWQMTKKKSQATYTCINYGEAVCPKEIERQSICINKGISKVLAALL